MARFIFNMIATLGFIISAHVIKHFIGFESTMIVFVALIAARTFFNETDEE